MDIKDILDSLGLDFSNPEAKRGAMEAIKAILDSRQPPMPGGAMPTGEIDVEIDPDLIQPSKKHSQPAPEDPDVEIEDEEDVLKQIKHNDSEEPIDDSGNNNGDDMDSDQESSNSQDADDEADADDSEDGTDDVSNTENTENEDESETDSDLDLDDESEESEETGDETDSSDSEETETEADDEAQASDEEIDAEDIDADETDVEDEESEDEATTELDSEDDLFDDDLKNIFDDQELKSKHDARKIKRERTLAAAKKALSDAKAKNVAPALIKELEKSIDALESLTEAKTKALKDLSDEEFNRIINRVFDAISAVGDNGLSFSTDEERALKAKEIKADLGSRETQQELSDEDVAAIRAETQAVKAREKETAQYKKPSRGSFKGFQEFLNSLYRAIALQVQTNEIQDDTWSAINRRYSGTGVLKQGQRKMDLPDKKIPIIDFYFDCSGSWGADDIAVGKKAVNALVEMEEKGQIKINIYYFSNHVFNDMQSALDEGGTQAWNEIVKNVIATQATNVIIMTDSDMEDWWEGSNSGKPALRYTVPGYVWYLWRDGDNAPRLPRDLRGRGGVQQFSFNRGSI